MPWLGPGAPVFLVILSTFLTPFLCLSFSWGGGVSIGRGYRLKLCKHIMSSKKTTPTSGATGDGSPFSFVEEMPVSGGLSEVFLAMASGMPEVAAESLCKAMMEGQTGEFDELEEEEVVELVLVLEAGLVCGGPVGGKVDCFCFKPAEAEMGTCGQSTHQSKKLDIKVGWYIVAGKSMRNGAFIKPRLDVEWIPKEAWGMLIGDSPMQAPVSIWKKFFLMAGELPVLVEDMVEMLEKQLDEELEEVHGSKDEGLVGELEDWGVDEDGDEEASLTGVAKVTLGTEGRPRVVSGGSKKS